MKINTVKGTYDYLPKEVRLRDYLTSVILETYQSNGFERIMTPILEDIENLNKSEGGENLGLIFKVLKRGDKLEKAIEDQRFEELSDVGLRYDLTLPLSRYYANNKAKLLLPFKCIQIDKVYRAERPQRGRLREFVQCDIDIVGASSYCAEVELIATTAQALLNIGISDFKIRINDRRVLRDILNSMGYEESQLETACIIIDKLDKIGADGIFDELKAKGLSSAGNELLYQLLKKGQLSIETAEELCRDKVAMTNLTKIVNLSKELSCGRYSIEYDMTLVRGQGYYTGTVFEIDSLSFKGSIGGGGRYDNLIGKFQNEKVPAVGFSIGFERIYSILLDNGFSIPNVKKRIAVIYEESNFYEAMQAANKYRVGAAVALFEKPKKVSNFLEKLKTQGYDAFYIQGQSEEPNELK